MLNFMFSRNARQLWCKITSNVLQVALTVPEMWVCPGMIAEFPTCHDVYSETACVLVLF